MTAPGAPFGKPPISGAGILLVVLGVIVALPTGACTGLLLGATLADGTSVDDLLAAIFPVLLLGVLPCGAGILLIWAGLRLRRDPTRPAA